MFSFFNRSSEPTPASETIVPEQPVLQLRGGAAPFVQTFAPTDLYAAPPSDVAMADARAAAPAATLSALGEFEAVAASAADVPFVTMASVRGGLLAAGGAVSVNEFVAVVDVSGSMSGEKIELAKQALMFVVEKGLDSADSFALVSFGTTVAVELSFVTMNAAGKRAALAAIKRLRVDGQTNLSGGLLEGLDLLAQSARADASANGVTRSIVLFTDGAANHGITDKDELVKVAAAQMPAIGPSGCAVFAFGFGSDHEEDLLRALSQVTPDGQYFFIEDADKICFAFAEVLGGLKSVVAQNAELCATVPPRAAAAGVVIARMLGGDAYTHTLAADGASVTIRLGDLYAEDEKDLLLELRLPWCAADASAEPEAIVEWSLRFFDIQARGFQTACATVAVARPDVAATQTTPARIVEERTRIRATEAIALATAAADKGEYGAGRELLLRARALCESEEVRMSPMAQALASDLGDMANGFAGEAEFKSAGRKHASLANQSYAKQRSALGSAAVYAKSAKAHTARRAEAWMDSVPRSQ